MAPESTPEPSQFHPSPLSEPEGLALTPSLA
jgi:hypothetical protein